MAMTVREACDAYQIASDACLAAERLRHEEPGNPDARASWILAKDAHVQAGQNLYDALAARRAAEGE
jgi:hypothetical protein